MKQRSEIEQLLGKAMFFSKTFKAMAGDDFGAYQAACDFIVRLGYSGGSMQRGEPIGIAKGEVYISKWRNLGPDVKELDGVMVADSFRDGDVTVYLAQNISSVA